MLRRVLILLALLTSALTMGLEFAHVLEWAPKATYSPALYTRLQESLYVWFGNVGGVVYVLAVLDTVALAVLTRHRPGFRVHTALAAGVQVVALATFLGMVYPVNFRFPVHGSGVPPADWSALRDRWELGHAIGFVLFLAAFVILLGALVRYGPGATSGANGSAPPGADVPNHQGAARRVGEGEGDGVPLEPGTETDPPR
jgi:hypothetical protein